MKILICTDGSEASKFGASLLARLPHKEKMELTILTVVERPETYGIVEPEVIEKIRSIGVERATASCYSISQMFTGANASVTSNVLEGHPGTVIVETANSIEADLIVMGAIGHSTLNRLLVGSVSDYVANHAYCSVLLVRPSLTESLQNHAPAVCIGYDGSPRSQQAMKSFCNVGELLDSKIHVVGIIPPPQIYSEIPIEVDTTSAKRAMEKVLAEGVEQCRNHSSEAISHLIETPYAGEGLVQFAEERDIDILVVGDTGKGILGRFFMGSVSRYVVRHAHCSVWIGRSAIR